MLGDPVFYEARRADKGVGRGVEPEALVGGDEMEWKVR
jgi:hypothetical protein